MKIHSVHFGEEVLYDRLAKVLGFSAEKNSPKNPITIHKVSIFSLIAEKEKNGVSYHEISNALKTQYHHDIVQKANDGEFLCLLDLDTLVLGDLSEAEEDFDLGYTVRKQICRINSGVIFVRISSKTKDWYRRWLENVFILLDDSKLRRKLKATYSGINQSALSLLLKQPHDLTLKEFPGEIWNCTPIHYKHFGPDTKIVHLLNKAKVLKDYRKGGNRPGDKIAEKWLELERENDKH